MRPHFNSHRPYNNHPQPRPQFHGPNAQQPPQQQNQVMPSPGNFCPNPMQMLPQFQLPMLNNPQLPMPPPFPNQNNNNTNNAFFPPNQLLPFQQAQMQQLLAHNVLMQNVNQLMQMQMMAAGGAGPQIPGNLANGPMGLVNFGGLMQPGMNGSGVGQQPPINGNGSSLVNNEAAAASQNNGGMGWKSSPNKNSNWKPNRDASQRGYNKQPFNHGQNAKGNFKFQNNNKRDQENVGAKDFSPGSSNPKQEGKKRTLVVNYTAEEIKKWREERRKNYPSKANVVDKTSKETAKPEVTDAAKARRQQLKEILAKQAELGCEVAEIPPAYLSDSEQQVGGRGANKRIFPKKERFQNKFNKRSKFHQNDRFPHRQRPADQDATNPPDQHNRFNKKQRLTSNPHMEKRPEPSLLKKLLSSDIKRDKKHLLQVFRFMTMNSFFKHCPETPLKFPEVVVRDDSKIVEEKAEAWNVDAINDSPENFTDIIMGNGEAGVLEKVAVICGEDDVATEFKGGKLVDEEQEEGEIIN